MTDDLLKQKEDLREQLSCIEAMMDSEYPLTLITYHKSITLINEDAESVLTLVKKILSYRLDKLQTESEKLQ